MKEKFRAYAKAEVQQVVLGVTPASFPPAFVKDKPLKLTASLLAGFVPYLIFKQPGEEHSEATQPLRFGQTYLIQEPLFLVLMQYAASKEANDDIVHLNWRPREEIQEAVDLTNVNFTIPKPELQLLVPPKRLAERT